VTTTADALVLLDAIPDTLPQARAVAAWSEREVPANVHSIPVLVERDAARLRDEYVAWTHDLGAFKVRGRDLRTRLALTGNVSFWWMTLLAEKEPLRSSGIYRVLKLRAVEWLYLRSGCRGIVYAGADDVLSRTLESWCRTLDHPYRREPRQARRRDSIEGGSSPGKSERFPYVLQAAWHLSRRWTTRVRPARRRAAMSPRGDSPRATIVTFFPNVDLERTRQGRFWSRYWERLHDLLEQREDAVDWVWLYTGSPQASFDETLTMLDDCNRHGDGRDRYFLFDEFLRPAVFARAVWLYLRVAAAALRLGPAKRAFRFSGSGIDFFPLLAHEWRSSFYGVAAADGALHIAGFEEIAARLRGGRWMLFVWENQPWELALIAAWRRLHPERIIGAQHSALGGLDLRSFADPRDTRAPSPIRKPAPDLLVVNGSGARDLLQSHPPADTIEVVEALRYLELQRVRTGAANGRPRTLLVVTGYKRTETGYQLRLLAEAARLGALDPFPRVVIKPHPFCPIESILRLDAFPVPPEITSAPVTSLWPDADAVFAANSTTAAVEASYVGLPVAVCAPADEMNLSPAFGQLDVPVVGTAAELAAFLGDPKAAACRRDFFLLDDSLTRWRALLSQS
jgi:surface carbohydrate biosynthesis protein (TIGR04326 family)